MRSAIALPCWSSVVAVSMAVDVAGGASVSVSGVEAGVGAVDIRSDSYCAAFGGGG